MNIGFACSLLQNEMNQYIVTAAVPEVLELEAQGELWGLAFWVRVYGFHRAADPK